MEEIEQMIKDKGADKAPRITLAHIHAQISHYRYIHLVEATAEAVSSLTPTQSALYCLTICVLVLANGFTVVGKSACASPENYNREIGEKLALDDCIKQVWTLEGYNLRYRLASGEAAPPVEQAMESAAEPA